METIKVKVLNVKLTAEELVQEVSKKEEDTRQKLEIAQPTLQVAEKALKVENFFFQSIICILMFIFRRFVQKI